MTPNETKSWLSPYWWSHGRVLSQLSMFWNWSVELYHSKPMEQNFGCLLVVLPIFISFLKHFLIQGCAPFCRLTWDPDTSVNEYVGRPNIRFFFIGKTKRMLGRKRKIPNILFFFPTKEKNSFLHGNFFGRGRKGLASRTKRCWRVIQHFSLLDETPVLGGENFTQLEKKKN